MNKYIPSKIFSLPFDTHSNRYFSLWRTAFLQVTGVTVSPVPKGGLLRLACTPGRARKWLIVIHWSTVLYGSKYALKSLALLVVNTLALLILKIRGATIFWVMHNARAHDCTHLWIEHVGRTLVCLFAHAVVVHQESMIIELTQKHPRTRVAHIPHGNYVDAYGPLMHNRQSARRHYGFAEQDTVFTAFGSIREYKKLETIIDAFVDVADELAPSVKLWIIGKGNTAYVRTLEQRAKPYGSRIIIKNSFVSDDEISKVFAASSYSVFYYDDSELTSGAIILSLSYGVPIVSRAIPAAEMIQNGVSGFFYNDQQTLSKLYTTLASTPPPAQERVIESVRTNDWNSVARSYITLYNDCHDKVS